GVLAAPTAVSASVAVGLRLPADLLASVFLALALALSLSLALAAAFSATGKMGWLCFFFQFGCSSPLSFSGPNSVANASAVDGAGNGPMLRQVDLSSGTSCSRMRGSSVNDTRNRPIRLLNLSLELCSSVSRRIDIALDLRASIGTSTAWRACLRASPEMLQPAPNLRPKPSLELLSLLSTATDAAKVPGSIAVR